MHIFIDLDYTLLDTHQLKIAMAESVKSEIDQLTFLESFNEILKSYDEGYNYTIESHAHYLAQFYALSEKEIYNTLLAVVQQSQNFLYPDALIFLEKMQKLPDEKILLTYGNKDFQEKKVHFSGIQKYFDRFIYTPIQKHLIDLALHETKIAFVNDNIKELLDLAPVYPDAYYFFINRHPKKWQSFDHPFREYSNLLDIHKEIITL